jgi:lipid-A-disaccharide synthase
MGNMSLIWIVAGEASGDARGAEVAAALLGQDPHLRMSGAGGPHLARLATPPFDQWTAQSAVLGLWDVLRHYGYFRRKFHGMLRDIAIHRPEAVLLVDYPGFNLRLAKALRGRGYPGRILFYISPQVWAWNRSRIPRMARILDLMICVFPFEQPMYEASGLHTVFAGHPLLEALLRDRTTAPRDPNLVALLPGSRTREVVRNLPAQVAAARLIRDARPSTAFEIAAASAEHADLARRIADDDAMFAISAGAARQAMRTAAAGIVCSGTATLEAAFFELPHCLIYKTAWLTFEVGRRLVDVNCLGILNILNNYRCNPPADPRLPAAPAPHIVREFIQHLARPQDMAQEVLRLLGDAGYRDAQRDAFRAILAGLRAEGAGARAAEAIRAELSARR